MFIRLPLSLSFQDYPERDEWAIVIYCQGCNRSCNGCHNSELQSEIGDIEISSDILNDLLQENLPKFMTNNIVFSGGDPLMSRQIDSLRDFLIKYGHQYNICIYTGANKKEIKEKMNGITTIKYFKGGQFLEERKTVEKIGKDNFRFQLATENQFFLDRNFNEISSKGVLCYG
jgi:organic radical activating enzyme